MRAIRNIAVAINIVLIAWLIWSFVEVNMYNLTNPAAISRFNAFYLIAAMA